jgi:tryptophanase
VEYLVEKLQRHNVPLIIPAGGHAAYLDAGAFLPQIPPEQFPGVVLANELFLEGGVRGVEIGSAMFGKRDPETGRHLAPRMELVRLAIPRRVYTQSHVDYVAEVVIQVYNRRSELRGLCMTYEAPFLRHFTAKYGEA